VAQQQQILKFPELSAQTRFLARGSALLTLLLLAWWFALQEPMLVVLNRGVQFADGFLYNYPASKLISTAPNGDWTFELPIEFTVSQNGAPVRAHSIAFDMARADVSTFTFSLPVFWAVTLAAEWTARTRRALWRGTLICGAAEIVLLMIEVQIFAHREIAKLSQSHDALLGWFLHLSDYLVVSVLPYIGPFVLAIWLHEELRAQILGWAVPEPALKSRARGTGKRVTRRRGHMS
jgi:hypothetical protein